jgi:CubicO group peptidase (beta-lactamase class C family)
MNKFKILPLLLFISFYSAAQVNTSKLNQYIALQNKRIGFSGVVLISKNNKVIYEQAIGKSSVELDIPLTANSKFKIASISKSFTAMLVMLALKDGKLKLSDSLAMYFPDLKGNDWRKITIDQLLSHRSGIPHDEGIVDYWLVKSLLALNNQQALTEIFKMQLLFKPGTDAKYSSPGYFLLAAILEKLYNKSFADILKEKITQPLKMDNTGIYNVRKIIPGISSSYHLLGDSLIVAPFRDFSLMKGSGDMYATAGDMNKWLNSFSGDIWGVGTVKQSFTSHSGKAMHSNDDTYGYGWFIRPASQQLKTACYHGGGTYGCSAIAVWYPDEKLSIVVLSNVSAQPVNEIWADIEKIIFNEPFELPQLKETIKLTPDQLQKYQGLYISEPAGMELQLIASNQQLFAKMGGSPAFEIFPESALSFYGKKMNIKFVFKTNQQGIITSLQADGRGQVITFNKK